MKDLIFMGDTLKQVRTFPAEVRRNAGRKLLTIQQGGEVSDVKSLHGIAPGVQELRLWDESGTYRVVYVAKFKEAVFVLHAFQKKTQATRSHDLDVVRRRYEEVRKSYQRS